MDRARLPTVYRVAPFAALIAAIFVGLWTPQTVAAPVVAGFVAAFALRRFSATPLELLPALSAGIAQWIGFVLSAVLVPKNLWAVSIDIVAGILLLAWLFKRPGMASATGMMALQGIGLVLNLYLLREMETSPWVLQSLATAMTLRLYILAFAAWGARSLRRRLVEEDVAVFS